MTDDSLDVFVEQLIEVGEVVSQIVAHMYANQGERPVPEVLRELLTSVLDPVRVKSGDEDVAIAGRVLADAVERISAEVFLVPARHTAGRRRMRG